MKNKGFTLIELLVVIAIIGILSTTVLGSLSDARVRARDAKRLADIRTIQTALEVYNLDNGTYPATGWAGSHTASWSNLENALETVLPTDPLNTSSTTSSSAAASGNSVYSYHGRVGSQYCDAKAYFLVFSLESRNGDSSNDGITLCDGRVFNYGNSFVVGVDRDGNFKTPDTSGTPK